MVAALSIWGGGVTGRAAENGRNGGESSSSSSASERDFNGTLGGE